MWTLELANSIVVFVGVHTGVRALWMVIAILGPRRLRGRNDRSEKVGNRGRFYRFRSRSISAA